MEQENDVCSIVLIDDSHSFCRLMEYTAEEVGIHLKSYQSLANMYSISRLQQFDLALIDYNLESWCGLEIADYIDVFFKELPVILVSGDDIEPQKSWPQSIKAVLHKKIGPYQLISESLEILQKVRFYRSLEKRAYSSL